MFSIGESTDGAGQEMQRCFFAGWAETGIHLSGLVSTDLSQASAVPQILRLKFLFSVLVPGSD